MLTSGIRGTVISAPDGLPIGAVFVSLTSNAGNGEKNAVTDDSGNFHFLDLALGFYTMQFKLVGFQSLQLDNVKVEAVETTDVNVRLKLAEPT